MVIGMAHGGARNRSGPPPDPSSGRSDRRGLTLTSLPASYAGLVPEFPLPGATERELELWAEAWSWPQANGWALATETPRRRAVAMWVRTAVRCEAVDAPANLLAQLHRFADQAALTPAGLAEAGWSIAKDEVRERRADSVAPPRSSSRSKLKVVNGGD